MNISVIGSGYVGLVTGACFAEFGMKVVCADVDKDKIHNLRNCSLPIYEPGLEDLVRKNISERRLNFTTDIGKAVKHADAIFIAVGTPALEDGSSDLQHILRAAREIAQYMDGYKLIINKSTVPVGTARLVKTEMQNVLLGIGKAFDFDVASNPEFLKEGTAVKDFLKPERIVVGSDSPKAIGILKQIYNLQILLDIPFIVTGIETAEMIKYASNAFLATKISFMNEIANLSELCGADAGVVSKAMGLDSRIGPRFLNPGPGFGGSCLTKDIKALLNIGKLYGYIPRIVKSALEVNYLQRKMAFKKIRKSAGRLENRTITVLGVAFKPETDDIRDSPAIAVIRELLKNKAVVKVYDPKAMDNAKREQPSLEVQYCSNMYAACEKSDCIAIFTEWDEFRELDFVRLKSTVNNAALVDLRNMFDPERIRNFGFSYQGVGRK